MRISSDTQEIRNVTFRKHRNVPKRSATQRKTPRVAGNCYYVKVRNNSGQRWRGSSALIGRSSVLLRDVTEVRKRSRRTSCYGTKYATFSACVKMLAELAFRCVACRWKMAFSLSVGSRVALLQCSTFVTWTTWILAVIATITTSLILSRVLVLVFPRSRYTTSCFHFPHSVLIQSRSVLSNPLLVCRRFCLLMRMNAISRNVPCGETALRSSILSRMFYAVARKNLGKANVSVIRKTSRGSGERREPKTGSVYIGSANAPQFSRFIMHNCIAAHLPLWSITVWN